MVSRIEMRKREPESDSASAEEEGREVKGGRGDGEEKGGNALAAGDVGDDQERRGEKHEKEDEEKKGKEKEKGKRRQQERGQTTSLPKLGLSASTPHLHR